MGTGEEYEQLNILFISHIFEGGGGPKGEASVNSATVHVKCLFEKCKNSNRRVKKKSMCKTLSIMYVSLHLNLLNLFHIVCFLFLCFFECSICLHNLGLYSILYI